MDNFFNKKIAKKMSYALNLIFLCLHVFFFVFFSRYKITIMQYFNVASIIFYLGGFAIVKSDKLVMYVRLIAFEVIFHMSLAVLCLGMGYGFQMTLLCMISIFFYSEYFSLRLNGGKSKVNGTLLSGMSFLTYMLLLFATRWLTPIYVINEDVQFYMCTVMSVIAFIVLIASLKLMTIFFAKSTTNLSRQAEYDMLTGLPNRKYMIKYLNKLFEGGEKEWYWIAMIDIDNFKRINDTYGHNFGDVALEALAKILSEQDDIEACRWGGEEFLIVGNLTEASRVPFEKVDGIRKKIEEYELIYQPDKKRVPLTVTIGAAEYSNEKNIDDWVSVADKRLYIGKNNGKNQVVCR